MCEALGRSGATKAFFSQFFLGQEKWMGGEGESFRVQSHRYRLPILVLVMKSRKPSILSYCFFRHGRDPEKVSKPIIAPIQLLAIFFAPSLSLNQSIINEWGFPVKHSVLIRPRKDKKEGERQEKKGRDLVSRSCSFDLNYGVKSADLAQDRRRASSPTKTTTGTRVKEFEEELFPLD